MKTDLDRLMAERNFDGLLLLGTAHTSHVLRYFLGDADLGEATIIKKRGSSPVVICNPMEREEAAKSGLSVETTTLYHYSEIIKEKGSYFDAEVALLRAILNRHGLEGNIAVYGSVDAGRTFMLLNELQALLPEVTITGEKDTSIFDEAYATKSPDELTHIREIAAITNTIFAEIITFLKSHQVKDDHLIKQDGQLLKIGDVKAYAATRLAYYGAAEEGGMIFAPGRDAGIPHSRGDAADTVRLGQSIVFDFFPYAKKTGYFHDMTRTLCLGYAPPEVQQAYEQVMQAYQAVIDDLRIGEQAAHYQDIVCDVFEEYGHPTPRTHPGTEEGYVHSVGHGLGLQIHSRPRFSSVSQDTIQPWQVFTVEPGLYYPDKGFGVRIEDTVYIDDAGIVHSLTPYPKDLVIEMDTL